MARYRWARVCTSPKPITAPLASGPGTFMPGFQKGCSIRPWAPGGTALTRASNRLSGGTPRSSASCCSCWPNCSLNQLTIQKPRVIRSEEHTSELQSQSNLVCRLLLEKKKKKKIILGGTAEWDAIVTHNFPHVTT